MGFDFLKHLPTLLAAVGMTQDSYLGLVSELFTCSKKAKEKYDCIGKYFEQDSDAFKFKGDS